MITKKEQIKKDRDTINEVLGTLSSEQYDDNKRVNMKTIKETMKSLDTAEAPKKLYISNKVTEYANIVQPKQPTSKPRKYKPEKSKEQILKDKAATRQFGITKNGKLLYSGLSQAQAHQMVTMMKRNNPEAKLVVQNVDSYLTNPNKQIKTAEPINE